MGLRTRIARRAVRSAHVFVVEMPGHWLTRVCVERAVRERGWHLALSPADADLLLICGTPEAEVAPLVERVWEQMPGPRARSMVTASGEARAAVDRAEETLLDPQIQRADARGRPTEPDLEHDDGDHEDMGHEGMDHSGMDMAPGGIPLAEGGEDRDGLEMDVLHVPLGPILAYWPAGLVLDCSLQGDVIVDAEATQLPSGPSSEGDRGAMAPATVAAVRLDNARHLLALAGWTDAAMRAQRLRDDVLRADDPCALRADLDLLRRRVGRNRLLRWSLRRVRVIGVEELTGREWPRWWAGDVHDRLLTTLDRAAASLRAGQGDAQDRANEDSSSGPVGGTLEALPQLVSGLDLATARLVVASLDLDPVGTVEVHRA